MKFNSRAILFDMDGVLVDNLSYHFDALKQWLKKYGHDLRNDEFKQKINGRTIQEIVQSYIDPKLSTQETMPYAEEKEALYRSLYAAHLEPTLGLPDFLERCRNKQIPMAVATSALPVNVDFTLDGLGIRHFFEAIIDSTQVTKGKPNPEIYQKAHTALGSPSHTWVIEDALAGVQAGKAAGLKVAGITTSHTEMELKEAGADFVFDDFNRLLSYI